MASEPNKGSLMTGVDRDQANWAAIAAEAGPELAALQRGERDEGLRQLAVRLALSPQFVRRAVAALSFVESVDLGANLRKCPLAGVETIRRWHRFDKGGAAKAAKRLAKGELISILEKDERAARDQPTLRQRITRFKLISYTQYVAHTLIGDAHHLIHADMERRSIFEPPCDLKLVDSHSGSVISVAMIIAPAYYERGNIVPSIFRKLIMALGLTYVYDTVMVVSPFEPILEECKEWLTFNRVRDVLVLKHISQPDLADYSE